MGGAVLLEGGGARLAPARRSCKPRLHACPCPAARMVSLARGLATRRPAALPHGPGHPPLLTAVHPALPQLLLRPAVRCGAAGTYVVEAAANHRPARHQLHLLAARPARAAPAPLVRTACACPAVGSRPPWLAPCAGQPAGRRPQPSSLLHIANIASAWPTAQVSAAPRRLPAGHPCWHGVLHVVCEQPPGAFFSLCLHQALLSHAAAEPRLLPPAALPAAPAIRSRAPPAVGAASSPGRRLPRAATLTNPR